jgi:hypothetical protein
VDEPQPNQLCRDCGYRTTIYGAAVCVPCFKKLGRETRRALGRLSHTFDQIKAACDEEERKPTDEEWAQLRALVGDDEDEADGE